MSALRAARSNGWPPTRYFHLFPDRAPGVLLREDIMLSHALQVYEDDLCSSCGAPSHISYTSLGDGEFKVDTATHCRACLVLDNYRKAQEKRAPAPGRIVRLVATWFTPKSEAPKKFTPKLRRRVE